MSIPDESATARVALGLFNDKKSKLLGEKAKTLFFSKKVLKVLQKRH